MLEVQVGGSWVTAGRDLLARVILDGVVDRSTPARDPRVYDAEGPLERLVGQSECVELAGQLLGRLHSMYSSSSASNEMEGLRARVDDLCKWDWPDEVTRARLTWAAAWLAELTGNFERAIGLYSAFLEHRSPDAGLEMLAHNNRGVLRIRLGQVEGVRDLARSAVPVENGPPLPPLPAACFNLLNLLGYAAESGTLRNQVETVLVDFMVKLPKERREKWLGRDPEKDQDGQEDLGKQLCILKDPTFRRLNRLTWRLAAKAQGIARGTMPLGRQIGQYVKEELCLWTAQAEMDVYGYRQLPEPQPTTRRPHAEYAEAASLLFASEIPSSLRPLGSSMDWALQIAREGLARAEDYLATGQYGLARSTLQGARQVLETCNCGQGLKALRRRVDRRLELVDRRQKDRERRDLYQGCAEMKREVERFCSVTALCEARRESEPLKRRLRGLCGRVREVWGEKFVGLLDEHLDRIEAHLGELERGDLEAKVRKSLQRLLDVWPGDWTNPVPDAAYTALAECRLHDPQGRVKDWDLMESQLDAHQAKHHFDRVIQSVSKPGFDRAQAEEGLATALSLDPNLGPAAAPLFGLLELPAALAMPGDLTELRAALLETAHGLLEDQPLGEDGVWSSAVRADLIRQACSLLKRLFRAFHGVGAEFVAVWRALEGRFNMALAESRPEVAAEIEQMIEACLPACPPIAGGLAAPSDPRNPLRILLEKCRRAKLLGHGEAALNAKDPQLDAAVDYFRSLSFHAG